MRGESASNLNRDAGCANSHIIFDVLIKGLNNTKITKQYIISYIKSGYKRRPERLDLAHERLRLA